MTHAVKLGYEVRREKKKSEPLIAMMTLIFYDYSVGTCQDALSFNHGNHLITGIGGSDNTDNGQLTTGKP